MNQITTCTFLKIEGLADKWWAFKQMQIGIRALNQVDGLRFFKLLGSGGKKGFSAFPNFGTYVLLCVWDSEEKAKAFTDKNPFYLAYAQKSSEHFTVFLRAAEVHGKWAGTQPFESGEKMQLDKPVLVLTRATIRFSKLLSFWRRVGKVSQSLDQYQGLSFSIGVGEWPLIQQATLSIWKTQAEMLDYAYTNPKHKEVVLLTRKLKWYKEEMFARFVPYKIDGQWNGNSVQNFF
jgi:heme-degrading monooxygenase HmoA